MTERVPADHSTSRRPAGWRAAGLAALAAAALALAIGLFALASARRDTAPIATRSPVEDITTLPPGEAAARADELTTWALEQVYAAFEEEEEAEIYDALAEAVAGDALDALYLQRRAALADRGLDGAGQVVHELELLSIASEREGDALHADARWRVLGLVGHDRHRHLRGNAYAADLDFSQVDGSWRITGFQLRDVDRTGAGEMVDAPPPGDTDTSSR